MCKQAGEGGGGEACTHDMGPRSLYCSVSICLIARVLPFLACRLQHLMRHTAGED